MRNFAAEMLGTFCLVFAGTGAIIVNDVSQGTITHVGVALTFGLIVLAMIYTVGDISGAHLNPAVTLGFWAAKRFPTHQVAPYLAAQLLGAIIASGCLKIMFASHPTLGATLPSGPWWQSFMMETILTLMLMTVILFVSHGSKEKGILAGVVIGAVIALEALFAGPISGASMNPARSFAPAILSGQLEHLWIYLAAPFLGSLIAVVLCRMINGSECCLPKTCVKEESCPV